MTDNKNEYIIKCVSNDYPRVCSFFTENNIKVDSKAISVFSSNDPISYILIKILADEDEMCMLKLSFSIEVLE